MTDISKEAVEAMAASLDEKVQRLCGANSTEAKVLRAQVARIEQLEAERESLIVARDMMGRKWSTAREDALREAAAVCTGDEDRPKPLSKFAMRKMTPQDQFAHEVRFLAWKDADEILALINKEPKL